MSSFLPQTRRTSSKNDQPGSTVETVTLLDANVYATKKTIAQGMLDVALLTANASQLKYLLQLGKEQQFFYLMVTLISLSIILQVSRLLIVILCVVSCVKSMKEMVLK